MNNNSAQQISSGDQPSAQAEAQIQVTPVAQEEVPTHHAEATIEVTKAKFSAGMRVPGSNTAQMINSLTRILGLVGSVAGPLMLLRVAVDLSMPWYGVWSLALTLAVMPVVHMVFGNRHGTE
ncbi:hypothetical protein ACFUVU_33485 [Streptomyces griseoincarnatus]